ncbi:MAG: DUF1800 domain-containing protein [Actinomycetota bacterium]|nr:DUF1800 domain-containing protein [Actinomycetota bacterium]
MTQSPEWVAMARLVRRTGFGATGAEVDAALRTGRGAFVERMLAVRAGTDAGSRAVPVPTFSPIERVAKNAPKEQKQARNKARRAQILTLAGWWLRRMTSADAPFEEKLTWYWHNHFATSATKVRSAGALLAQNEMLRRLGRGNFAALGQAVLIDAAMLYWLDGEKNTVQGANENLAREFMELFALGHGSGYTETDVREGARALTGWQVRRDGTAALVPRRHDAGAKTVLGVTGNLDQVGFGDAVLAQPASARHVATRMYGQLVSDTPPERATVDRLVAAYGPDRDLTRLLRAMLLDPSFAAAADSLVLGPLEWLTGAVRAMGTALDEAGARKLLPALRGLGQIPFYPPSVAGWPNGQAWLSTAAADVRLRTATELAAKADLSALEHTAATGRLDAVGHLIGVGRWSQRSVAALKPALSRPPELLALALNTPEYLVH